MEFGLVKYNMIKDETKFPPDSYEPSPLLKGEQLGSKKIVIVCDWIIDMWGAEIVLKQLLDFFPQADIYTSIFFQKDHPIFQDRKVTSSFIQKIPILGKSHKLALLLRPQAFESFDLSEYDIVISSSSAESKWVITKPETLHICYCHTPTRYFWSHYHEYLTMMEFGLLNPLAKWLMPKFVYKLRQWDFVAAQRPDYFIANSKNTQWRIEKYYNRDSQVIYPCLNIEKIPFSDQKEDYYFYTGRCIPYKKFDLLIETFNENGKKLKIATNTDTKLYRYLKSISKSNIEWICTWDLYVINTLHSKAKAFLFPPEEDFGLAPIAAQATGTPVIAYAKWWALETVIAEKTGIFFSEQTIDSLNKAIVDFEKMSFDYTLIRTHAEKFSLSKFESQMVDFIADKMYNKKV